MRFLLLNQFYPPDVAPTGRYLHDLARGLVRRGHEVQVLCSRRSYDGTARYPRSEVLDGVTVTRLPATGYGRRGFAGKIADYTSFYVSLLYALLFRCRRPDMILALTTPPYIGVLARVAAFRHRSRHAHWVMDLYPDAMLAHGMKRSWFVTKPLQGLTRYQFKGAAQVLALGPAMAQRVEAYTTNRTAAVPKASRSGRLAPKPYDNAPAAPLRVSDPAAAPSESRNSERNPPASGQDYLRWFPLWSDPGLAPWPEDQPNLLRIERKWGPEETVLLYSGNMGLGHRFGEFLEAAGRLGTSGPRWVFAGGGKRKPEVEAISRSIPGGRVELMGYVPNELLRAHLCAADVHLVSLDSAWQGFMVPSKLQGSFAVGRPVIYVGGRNCETAQWLLESGGGWVVDENDITGLLAAIRQALVPEERRRRGLAALQFARRHFQMEQTCAQIAELLEREPEARGHREPCVAPASRDGSAILQRSASGP